MQSSTVAANRIRVLLRILKHNKYGISTVSIRAHTTDSKVTIGGVTKTIKDATHPEYVPRNYCKY